MLLSIIIVSYNTKELTVSAVESAITDVTASSRLKNKTEIIIVDNNSQDQSVPSLQAIARRFSWVRVIANQTNSGYAQANNQGILAAQGQYLLLLNSDTLVQPGALDALVTTFEKYPVQDRTAHSQRFQGKLDRLGILSATLLNPDGTVQHQGGSFPSLFNLGIHMLMLDDLPLIGRWLPSTQHTGKRGVKNVGKATVEPYQQDWVTGAAFALRREVIAEIGLLDEQIFMYGEDVEYCLRAQNHHWDVAIDPTAKITHIGSASSSSSRAIQGELKGYIYIWSKHKPLWQMPFVRFMIRVGCYIRIFLFGTILRNSTRAQVYQDALGNL